ncbi:mycofactocin-coupled SDR family oxidoreductase [Blastococcus sp. BMG 814]|uniref:Mycofactocin-coupled SDR family oxidoreductase n=1 Tax=Blastococcus carthaginiensis TaxID=3050034 RepID=A0ABT9I7V2_9ACTN|nr:mycofactocin-coupled SDR family oxidoreductase [Blastococcus carthaginiensis]MDP5181646.1 mycofactocin-coupled SDR family oxidoreductase [Blastococcus carthaginiensis]
MTTSTSGRLAGKVAYITGAARGQGRAHAVRLAAEGADVIAIDNCATAATTSYAGPTEEDLAETARLVEAQGRRVLARTVDVRDLDGQVAVVADGVAELGRLDVVVANAGICSGALSWEIPVEKWQETIDVNLTGTFYTAKATVPVLLEQGTGGSIIIISSVAGLRGLPFLADYAASKHGVTGLARTMANELGQHNIRVNTVHPHGVATGMQPAEMFELSQRFATTLGPILMQALPDPISQPEDIANAVAWLASDEARHVTGIQLPVDLGTLAR